MLWSRVTYGVRQKCTGFWVGTTREGNRLTNKSVNVHVIQCNLNKYIEMYLVVDTEKYRAVVTMGMNVLGLRNAGNLSVNRRKI